MKGIMRFYSLIAKKIYIYNIYGLSTSDSWTISATAGRGALAAPFLTTDEANCEDP
jgi:hypothetical protein